MRPSWRTVEVSTLLALAVSGLPKLPCIPPLLSSPPAARLSGGGAWGQGADLHAAAAAAACAQARRRRRSPCPRPAGAAPCLWRGPRGGEGEDRLLG